MTERYIDVRDGKIHIGTIRDHFYGFLRENNCGGCPQYEERVLHVCWCCGRETLELECHDEGLPNATAKLCGGRKVGPPCELLRGECNGISNPSCPHYLDVMEEVK